MKSRLSESTVISNPIIAPNTQQRIIILKSRSKSPNKMKRPDEYLDKFHSLMDELWRSGDMQNGSIKNTPSKNYVIGSNVMKVTSFDK